MALYAQQPLAVADISSCLSVEKSYSGSSAAVVACVRSSSLIIVSAMAS
jgi:hypothetical protein